LAELACSIEIDKLKEPVGKQDQYISSFGGIKKIKINKNGYVDTKDLKINKKQINRLENKLSLFFTGYLRKSSTILSNQKKKTLKNEKEMIKNLHDIKQLGIQSGAVLEQGNLNDFAYIMDEHWKKKMERDKFMSNSKINKIYQIAIEKGGALGGKLVGAGGGGFLMFYSNDEYKLTKILSNYGLKAVNFSFEFNGTQVLIQDVR